MSSNGVPSGGGSTTVQRVLTDYITDREAGRSPDADHYATRLRDPAGRQRFYELVDEYGNLEELLPAPESLPVSLGPWTIEERLGSGGMGVVYAATDGRGRHAALKVLPEKTRIDERVRARFLREIDALAAVDHPGIVRVLDHGTDGGRDYVAMEQQEGGTLEQLIERRRRKGHVPDDGDVRETCAMVAKIARGLHAVHEQGIVHRDVKPANILFGADGEPRLGDFGLVYLATESTLTTGDKVLGTPAYIAPERLLDPERGNDPGVDIYSLGVTLYEAITGVRPFSGALPEMLAAVRRGPPSTRLFIGRDLDNGLAAILERCLGYARRSRYATALDLAEDLEAWADGRRVRAVRGARRRRLKRLVARHRGASAAIAGAALVVVVLAGLQIDAMLSERRREEAVQRQVTALLEDAATSEQQLSVALAGLLEATEGRSLAGSAWSRLGYGSPERVAQIAGIGALRSEAERAFGDAERVLVQAQALGSAEVAPRLAALHAAVARWLDRDGRHAEAERHWLQAVAPGERPPPAALAIDTSPSGAELTLLRYDRTAAGPWPLVQVGDPVTTPARFDDLLPGSYLVELRRPDGERTIRLPLLLRRDARAAPPPVALPTDAEIGDDWEYLPPGPFISGGDLRARGAEPRLHRRVERGVFMRRHELTYGEWFEFLEDEWPTCPLPNGKRVWPEHLPYHVPRDSHHDPPEYAVDDMFAGRIATMNPAAALGRICMEDAQHYLDWLNARALANGEPWEYGLPSGDEWERAARGADGRPFTWGDDFDWSYAYGGPTRYALQEERQADFGDLHLVPGRHPDDRSPFGILDLVGNVRELCRDRDPLWQYFLVSGGEENYFEPDDMRLAARRGALPTEHNWDFGVRLVRWRRE